MVNAHSSFGASMKGMDIFWTGVLGSMRTREEKEKKHARVMQSSC